MIAIRTKFSLISFVFLFLFFSGCLPASQSSGRIEDLPEAQQAEMKDLVKRLLIAVEAGDTDDVKSILAQGVFVNTLGEFGKTALHVAAEKNNPEICRLLLEAGAQARPTEADYEQHLNPPLMDQNGMTPADYSVLHMETLKVFLDAGVPLESRGFMGFTLLQMAVSHDCVDSAQLLIDRGADIHVNGPTIPAWGRNAPSLMELAKTPEMRELLQKAEVK